MTKSHNPILLRSLIGLTSAAALALAVGATAEDAQTQQTQKVIIMKDGGKMSCNIEIRMAPPAFADVDTNHDGTISKDEFEAFHKMHHPMMDHDAPGAMGHDGPPPGGDCGPGEGAGGPHMKMRRIEIRGMEGLDTNKDGKLSLEEFTAPLRDHFNEMDTNHDGFVDASEMPKHMMDHDGPPPPAK